MLDVRAVLVVLLAAVDVKEFTSRKVIHHMSDYFSSWIYVLNYAPNAERCLQKVFSRMRQVAFDPRLALVKVDPSPNPRRI
jgi:hypothetical protein